MASYSKHFNFLQTISLLFYTWVISFEFSTSLDDECIALFEFKESILPQDYATFDDVPSDFQKFSTWKLTGNASNNSFSCCLWDGVTCNDQNYVISLDLSESFLFGRIDSNSTLFKLVHLQRLNLAMNDFTESHIPSEIHHLKNLKSLNLSGSGFTGQIPNEISFLMELSSLDLSWNPLKLQSPNLENLVKNLSSLEELNLSGVNISSSVPHFLANFSSLRSINLANCQLQDEFPVGIFHLPKLKFLTMTFNKNLTGFLPEFHNNNSLLERVELAVTSFYGIVPESITNLKYLIKLNLDECSFSGRIPGSIANMTQLTYLTLGFNEFIDEVPSFVSLSKLSVLSLSYNKFERDRLPSWLGKLTKLNELYLHNMNIYEEFPPFLANLSELSVIDMSGNSFFGHIPPSLMNLTRLRLVNIGTNQLQGPISSLFSNLRSLEYLRLNNNNLSGMVEMDIFVGLKKLNTLLLGGNKISFVFTNNFTRDTLPALRHLGLASCNLKEFPPFLRFKHKMSSLFLDRNKIDGLVPVWIWNNSKETLQTIDISNNFITGFHQDPDILPWVRLETVIIANNEIRGHLPVPPKTTIVYDASNNNLKGEISPLMCEMKSLRLLDLSSNNMSGTLPPCFGSLSNSLFVLNLKRNNFHGRMMNAFTQGSLLKRIDLSENQFQGPISKSLVNCTSLEVLSLGDNYFDDIFPFWLGHLADLQVLILRSNKFHGEIQDLGALGSPFPKMRIIDLSNNGFSGRLPNKYFQVWDAMKLVYVGKSSIMQLQMSFLTFTRTQDWPFSMTLTYKGVNRDYSRILNIFTAIDLSNNNFEGEIPESLQDLQGLESLNLSNNHLTGHILPNLGNLKNLESLDLSQNQLSGEIPQELVRLGFLAIFNLSFNHLHGHIPQGKQFNTFENNSYLGNPRLCGEPLYNECHISNKSTLTPTSNEYESLLPSDIIDWIIVFLGVGSGLLRGTFIGNTLYTRYGDWLIERFKTRKDTWIRPLSNTKRSTFHI